MKKETAKVVHQFFDQESLKIYVQERLVELYSGLEDAPTPREISLLQGRIKELRYLLKAKEYAEGVLKNG